MAGPKVSVAPAEGREGMSPETQGLLEGLGLILAGERGLAQLYATYAGQTLDPALSRKWREFGERAQVHVQVAEGVITALRGDPSHRSEGAAQVERCLEAMHGIAAPEDRADLFRLGNLVMLDDLTGRYWRNVRAVAPRTREPSIVKILSDAARIVERDKEEHAAWNTARLDSHLRTLMTGR